MFGGDDFAKNPGMSTRKLESFLDDINAQPEWRTEADRACAYYDCNQLDSDIFKVMIETGQPIITQNLIAPAIDGVLGAEAKTRTDLILKADDDSSVELVDGLNEKFNEMQRLSRSSRSISDAYANQVKCGVAWVEVNRTTNPFDYEFRVDTVHRREIFWDWHAKPDLSDARWLLRRRWIDVDEAILYFPQHEELIKYASKAWSNFDVEVELTKSHHLLGAYHDYSEFKYDTGEWYDSERERALIYEIYYRVFKNTPVILTPDNRIVEVDETNSLHIALISSGRVNIFNTPVPKMRLAYFIGPHRLIDVPSPQPHNYFPYVPFWGFREDKTDVPYGLIRRMFSAQDEINHRRSKLTNLLNSKRVIKDEDALENMSEADMLDELHRPDGVINLNPARRNRDANAFRVETDFGIASQQFQVMQEAQKIIQDVAGIYSSFLGQEGAATSGVAINSLVEQGSTTLAELNDNFRYGKTRVGELMVANLVHSLSYQKNVRVKVDGKNIKPSKVIFLNNFESGDKSSINDVKNIKYQVALAEISSTPGYRAQIAQQLTNIVGQLPPNVQAAVLDIIIEATDLPNKEELIKRIRQVTGFGVDQAELTEEQLAAQQAKSQEEQEAKALAKEEVVGRLNKLAAEARKMDAEARKTESSISVTEEKASAEIQKIQIQIAEIAKKIQSMSFSSPSNF